MTKTSGKCDPRLLRTLVEGGLSTHQREEREQHLSTCQQCRDELKNLAGDDSWWSGVKEYLKPGELDPPSVDGSEFEGAHLEPANLPLDLTFLGPTDDPAMLGRMAGYEISGVIGQGGMGLVLKGFDSALNRYCAIKVLAPHLASSGAARRRFAREAKAAAAVVHENVVAIHAVSESANLPYLVMPYLRGKSLERRLRDEGPLSVEQVLRIGMQIAQGLAAAHAQGLVHRDIKPSNILLADDVERVAITDFGLARAADDASLTRSGWIAGTPQYMSPEQAKGDAIDHRSDLFSLGSLMYAMCAGRPPFRAESSYAVLRKIIETPPRDLREINQSIPTWLTGLISRLMEKSPAARFQTAEEAAETMRAALSHIQAPAVTPLPKQLQKYAQTKLSATSRWIITLSTIALLAACSVVLTIRNLPTTIPPTANSQLPTPLTETDWETDLDRELPFARQRAAALSQEIGDLAPAANEPKNNQ